MIGRLDSHAAVLPVSLPATHMSTCCTPGRGAPRRRPLYYSANSPPPSLLARQGVRPIAHSCLGHNKSDLLANPVIEEVAKELGVAPAQVLLRWNLQRGVGVIPKAGSKPHVLENADVFSFALSFDQNVSRPAAAASDLACTHACVRGARLGSPQQACAGRVLWSNAPSQQKLPTTKATIPPFPPCSPR